MFVYELWLSTAEKLFLISEGKGYSKIYKQRYPKSIQVFKVERGLHPTQKPVPLMGYLVATYTKENDTVLDFAMGSGTTGVACKVLKRNFVGIEIHDGYFEMAKKRIAQSVRKDGLQTS